MRRITVIVLRVSALVTVVIAAACAHRRDWDVATFFLASCILLDRLGDYYDRGRA